jgi:hypothetical protein
MAGDAGFERVLGGTLRLKRVFLTVMGLFVAFYLYVYWQTDLKGSVPLK